VLLTATKVKKTRWFSDCLERRTQRTYATIKERKGNVNILMVSYSKTTRNRFAILNYNNNNNRLTVHSSL